MQINWLRVLALSVLVTLGVTSVAWAHTTQRSQPVLTILDKASSLYSLSCREGLFLETGLPAYSVL